MFERSAMKKRDPKMTQTTVSPANVEQTSLVFAGNSTVEFDRMVAAAELANPYNDF